MASTGFVNKLKRFQRVVIKALQQVLLPVCLTLAYVLVLGFTWPIALIFAPRRGLGLCAGKRDSYWKKAEGYRPEIDACRKPF